MHDVARIQSCVRNRLNRRGIKKRRIAGIIGDAPSLYAKSPPLWNAVFRALKLKAIYLPFDVEESRLGDLVSALKKSDQVLGVNVTVPYKLKIIEYLDGLDERAAPIKAINTVVRTADGQLIGYNTDGKGFMESVMLPQPGQPGSFLDSLDGTNVLIIGAGGAARAVALHLAETVGKGQVLICNRTPVSALSLAEDIQRIFGNARALKEEEIGEYAPTAGLIVNCSTKGQGGIRRTRDGKITIMEPYSALAPANPAALSESEYGRPEFYRAWLQASLSDIETNNRSSWDLSLSIPLETGFCDLIYHPEESVFLRHGRLSGHRTLNGKGMIVHQAVEALFKICGDLLQTLGTPPTETRKLVSHIMWTAW